MLDFTIIIMVFVISIILHEFGHYSMVKHLGAKPNV